MAKILNISGTDISDRGIQKLVSYVESNLPDDYTLVIGCKPYVYDVDAVLIGNGNIFAIECKNWKGNIVGESYGWWKKDGDMIENPLQQTRNNTVALGKWLRSKIQNAKGKLWVKGLLLFTHDESQLDLNLDKTSNVSVSILHLNEFYKLISKQKNSLDIEATNIVVSWFKQFLIDEYPNEIKVSLFQKLINKPFKEKLMILWYHFIAWDNQPYHRSNDEYRINEDIPLDYLFGNLDYKKDELSEQHSKDNSVVIGAMGYPFCSLINPHQDD